MPRKLLCLLPCALLALASCSQQRYPVEGKVTLDGHPLKTGTVLFWTDAKAERSGLPRGDIRTDGSYSLHTGGAEGAPAGTYKVTVSAEEIPDSTKPEKSKLLVPKKYMQPDTTPLTVKVVQIPDRGAYDLTLTRD
jgi:hypothetical protein